MGPIWEQESQRFSKRPPALIRSGQDEARGFTEKAKPPCLGLEKVGNDEGFPWDDGTLWVRYRNAGVRVYGVLGLFERWRSDKSRRLRGSDCACHPCHLLLLLP